MIRQTLLLLTIALMSPVFSQDTARTTFNMLSIGLSGGVNACSNIKAPEGTNHVYSYTPAGFRFGLDALWHLSRRSALRTGVYYFNVAYKADYAWVFMQPNDPNIPRSTDISMNYFDIPLLYDFRFMNREQLAAYTSGGISASFLHSQKGATIYEDNSVRDFENSNSFLASLQLGIGLQYNIHKNLGVRFELHHRLFLKNFDSIMGRFPMASNASIGVVAHLNGK